MQQPTVAFLFPILSPGIPDEQGSCRFLVTVFVFYLELVIGTDCYNRMTSFNLLGE
jgi:hypothetical protein